MPWRVAASIVLMYVTLLLPLKTAGCGQSACITVTSADLVNGQCPDRTAALARFSQSQCGASGTVSSVDGAGTLSDGLCCYPVSNNFNDSPPPICGEPGETDTGSDFGTGGGSFGVSSSAGSGGAGGGISVCASGATCAAGLKGTTPLPQVCGGGAATALDQLKQCACATNCPSACDPTLCTGNAPDNTCLGCLEGSCAAELMNCQAN